MKKFFGLIAAILMVLFGCGGIHTPFSYAKNDPVTERGIGDFIKLSSGEIIKAQKLQWKKSSFILDGSKTYEQDDVIAYQSGDKYAARVKNYGFFDRIVKGKINVYRSISTGANDIGRGGTENSTSAIYYVQKGTDGELLRMTPKVLQELTKDNSDAHEKASKLGNVVVNIPKMESVIKLYNE